MNRDRILRNLKPADDGCSLPLQRRAQPTASDKLKDQSGIHSSGNPIHSVDRDMLRQEFAHELENLFEQARQAGFEKGQADAESRIAEEIRSREADREIAWKEREETLQLAVRNFKAAASSLEEQAREFIDSRQDLVIESVSAAVLKILERFAKDGSLIRRIARAQLRRQTKSHPLRVRISAEEMHLLSDSMNSDEEAADLALFEVDESLTAGECHLDFESGTLDASLNLQLERFHSALKKSRDNLLQQRNS